MLKRRYFPRSGQLAVAAPCLLLLMTFAAAVTTGHASARPQQAPAAPIRKDNLLRTLQTYGPAPLVIQAIRYYGVDFRLTDEIEEELEDAGANAEVIEAVRSSYRPSGGGQPTQPTSPGGTYNPQPSGSAEAYIAEGAKLLEARRFTEAIQTLRRALEFRTPNAFLAHFFIGGAHFGLDQYREAVASFEQSIRLKPDFGEGYVYLSAAYTNLDKYQDAVAAARQALLFRDKMNRKETAADAYIQLSYNYNRLDQYAESMEASREAARIQPDYALAYNNLAYTQNQTGQHQAAIASSRRALQLRKDPNDVALAYYNIGIAHDRMNQRQLAVEAYTQSIAAYGQSTRPLVADEHVYLGDQYLQMDRAQEAIAAYREAIRTRPNFAHPHFSIGVAYLFLDDKRSALAEYNILKNLHPGKAARLLKLINGK
ncbi:MAG: tetratricopeptide repeat protein [Pyrinomonadaceae bacterium]